MKAPTIYSDDAHYRMPVRMLPEAVYAEAIQSLIVVCTDAAIVNRTRKTIYLARRVAKPLIGLWWIGGRWLAGESAPESVQRCVRRETGLTIANDRFDLVSIIEYRYKTRSQMPQDIGCQELTYTYAVELSDAEIARAAQHLDPKEYDVAFGLQEFNHDQLREAKVHLAILDLYTTVFVQDHL